jgi:hypothetical protein
MAARGVLDQRDDRRKPGASVSADTPSCPDRWLRAASTNAFQSPAGSERTRWPGATFSRLDIRRLAYPNPKSCVTRWEPPDESNWKCHVPGWGGSWDFRSSSPPKRMATSHDVGPVGVGVASVILLVPATNASHKCQPQMSL